MDNFINSIVTKIIPKKVLDIIEKVGLTRIIAISFVLLGLGTIAFTLVMQLIFNVKPCILCYYQRAPYILAGIIGCFLYQKNISSKAKQIMSGMCFGAFTINIGIGIYNIGIEHKFWEGSPACKGNTNLSFDSLQTAFNEPLIKLADCSVIQWSLFGQNIFTLALINTITSCFLSIVCFYIIRKRIWK